MKQFTIHQAKTNLSRLIQMALRGDEVVIAKGDEPLVRLTVFRAKKGRRVVGDLQGSLVVASDFNAPIPDMDDYQ